MQQQHWNTRYREHEWVYGRAPNPFFRRFIDRHPPGRLLLPAEGEGRNAVYAARRGWQVDAFDFSEVARQRALRLARDQGVEIHYWLQAIESFQADKPYDAVALLYVHLPEAIRKPFHRQVARALAPGGWLLLEAFAPEQLRYRSGGPQDKALLYDTETLRGDFADLQQHGCRQLMVELDEGPFHQGQAALVQLEAQKPPAAPVDEGR